MTTGNGQAGEWVNLYGSDGKKKAAYNWRTGELVVKERNTYHRWRLATIVDAVCDTDGRLPVETAPAAC